MLCSYVCDVGFLSSCNLRFVTTLFVLYRHFDVKVERVYQLPPIPAARLSAARRGDLPVLVARNRGVHREWPGMLGSAAWMRAQYAARARPTGQKCAGRLVQTTAQWVYPA